MDEILKYFPHLSKEKIDLLEKFTDLLVSWNARINLVSRQDTDHLVERHILHSLAISKLISFPEGSAILDLGTGGGLPGIPLAICFPNCSFTLIDGRGKKIHAVQSMIKDLGLINVTAIHTRAEDFNGQFDFIVTRAVASLAELWKWSRPLIPKPSDKKGTGKTIMKEALKTPFAWGRVVWAQGLIVLKGGDMSKEISEIQSAGPLVYEFPIKDMFSEPYFSEKCILFISSPISSTSPASPA